MNNERLIMLANECTSYKEGFIEGKHDIEEFDKEKFAELIIRECVSVCEEHKEMYAMLADTQVEFAAMTTAATSAASGIKKHFGVEE